MYRALAIAAALVVSGCQRVEESRMTHEEIQAALRASADDKRHDRQKMMDEASIVCRDGWAYLAGDDHDTHPGRRARNGVAGPFVTPYMRNGAQGRCVGQSAAWNSGKEE